MLLFIQCIITCAIFSAIMLPLVIKNPINHLMSYPKAIRQRVESLPEYKDVIKKTEAKDILRKIIAAIILTIILVLVSYYSNARTFKTSFLHCFILTQSVNWFDVFILDLIIFCNSKKVIIKGTEDMVSDYKNKKHHLIGGLYGLVICSVISLIVALVISII